MDKIAVLLASYNGEKYIKEQIGSILNQENVYCKVFVFDDNSSDNTLQIIKNNFSEKDVLIFTKNVATGSAALNFFYAIQNIDLKLIEGFKYFAFADQDDVWLPTKLNRATTMLHNNKKALYASNLTQWVSGTDKKTIINKAYSQKKFDYLFEGASAGCTYVFNIELFLDLRELLPNLNLKKWNLLSHDWLVYFYARYKKYGVIIDSESYILYRLHDKNVHGHLNAISFSAFKQKTEMIKEGWYMKSIDFFSQIIDEDSEEMKIYKNYKKGVVSRFLVVIKYNTSLMRSFKKLIAFFFFSLIPIRKNV